VALAHHLAPLTRLEGSADRFSPAARGLVRQLIETMGILPRAAVENLLAALSPEDRRLLRTAGVRIGVVHVHVNGILKPEATRWRLALWGVHARVERMPPPPHPGRVAIAVDPAAPPGYLAVAGYWAVAGLAVRVDMVDRTARAVHAQRLAERAGVDGFRPDPALASALGISAAQFARLMRALGFRSASGDGRYAFSGRRRARRAAPVEASPHFSALQDLMGG
jgi:ATP-dependent RNA helicase SUPV3L1/SUV3